MLQGIYLCIQNKNVILNNWKQAFAQGKAFHDYSR